MINPWNQVLFLAFVSMVNYLSLAVNAIWVFGLACLLAVWSMASYQANAREEKITVFFALPLGNSLISVGGFLFCLGLAAADARLLSRIFWLIMSVLIVYRFLYRRQET